MLNSGCSGAARPTGCPRPANPRETEASAAGPIAGEAAGPDPDGPDPDGPDPEDGGGGMAATGGTGAADDEGSAGSGCARGETTAGGA